MTDIYHIVKREDWRAAVSGGRYEPRSLDHEGFIHCARRSQVVKVANALFAGNKDLVLLSIDASRVLPEVRSEDCYDSGELFPHIYGPLNVDAVTKVSDFPPDKDGAFLLPPDL